MIDIGRIIQTGIPDILLVLLDFIGWTSLSAPIGCFQGTKESD